MTGNINICAVIPACNEEATIGEIVRETKKYIRHVYVVDNGSTDKTREIAESCGATIIACHLKKGYGITQYTGQQFALERGFDYILQLDADGQHDPDYIPLLLETMKTSDCDIVLGSRFLDRHRKSNLSATRYAGIKFFSRLVSIIGRANISDVTSGYKVYKASCLKQLSKPCEKHPAIEQMLEIARRGMKIKEIPIEMPERINGKSHLSLTRFAVYPFRALWLIVKVSLSKRT